jgi:hypothetical protein
MPTTKKQTPQVKVRALSVARPPRSDLDVSGLVLSGPKSGGKALTAAIQRAITSGTIENTIDGASTLTLSVNDPYKGLLRSQLIKGPVRVSFDGLDFTLTKVQRQDMETVLTFEETGVNLLRQYSGPKKADRANSTRAAFVRSMVKEVREAKIPFQCPEINKRQPISKPSVT